MIETFIGIDQLNKKAPDQFFISIGRYMHNRDNGGDGKSWHENVDESNIFPTERRLSMRLLTRCGEYMPDDNQEIIRRALAMMLIAHQGQYRESRHPFSVHPLETALALAKKRQDPVLVADGLLHDTKEDTDFTLEMIKSALSYPNPEVTTAAATVADDIDDLSKQKGVYESERVMEIQYLLQIISSSFYNPRVAIVKLEERLQNMRWPKKNRAKRLAMAEETLQIYVPQAKRLGLFDLADKLESLCYRSRNLESYPKLEKELALMIKDFSRAYPPETIKQDILSAVSVKWGGREVYVRTPFVYDIYRRVARFRQTGQSDMYLNADIVLPVEAIGSGPYEFGEYAISGALSDLIASGYEIVDQKEVDDFRDEIMQGLTDALMIRLGRSDGLLVRAKIYPKDVYDLEQTPMTDRYLEKYIPDEELDRRIATEELDEITARQYQALSKQRRLIQKYETVVSQLEEGEELAPDQLVRLLQPRNEGNIWVVGINDENVVKPWPIPEGATVMDYVGDIFRYSWQQVTAVFVNGRKCRFDYVLRPRDRIHAIRVKGGKIRIRPEMIAGFQHDKEKREACQEYITRQQEKLPPEMAEKQRQELRKVGRKLLAQIFGRELETKEIRSILTQVYGKDASVGMNIFLENIALGKADIGSFTME